MKKEISIYELLGLVNDNPNKDIYIKFFDRDTGKEDVMWACLENIFDRLDNKHMFLNDKVEIIEEPKELEELNLDTDDLKGKEIPRAIDYLLEGRINKIKEKIEHYDLWHEVGTDINFLILKRQLLEEILNKIEKR